MSWNIVRKMPGLRISELGYGGHVWYKIEVLQAVNTEDKEYYYSEWVELRKCKYVPEANAFSRSISSAEIIDEMKKIDEESRHTKKKERW